ncbi:hypothetical protein CkaCkLH20_07567 [Colletotrichum karsti]|uniref:Uncharacterized protein n=1 Tax=Colletotrichum karsti TaxID=1095194 RepID=A0A9P6LIQ3_9PEZI|nr:uncharacterized protein CkaCkLH20_07567 [Colletotrichum karsti]KAF9874873.1 hypothetical protein CkaCkLH20_07567 [Colletotrichum karsti]
MQFPKPLLLTLTLASVPAQGYVITIFDGKDCAGASKRVNVYDNTCRDGDVLDTASLRVETYGARLQKADVYPSHSCGTVRIASWAADGGSGGPFRQGDCLNLEKTARAFGSRSG